jgi:predicted regulator of Ras-like GTPase activity (Roadblock/LC7/MglB family)
MATTAESRKQELESLLSHLAEFGEISGAAIVRRDGLMIASSLPQTTDSRTIAAMSAAIIGTTETSVEALHLGRFPEVIVEAEKGKLIAVGAGTQATLVCLVRATGNIGLVLLEMGRAAEQIANKLE